MTDPTDSMGSDDQPAPDDPGMTPGPPDAAATPDPPDAGTDALPEPTMQMPIPAAAAPPPPIDGDVPLSGDEEPPPLPWYRRPGPLLAIAGILLALIIIVIVVSANDDESSVSTTLVVERQTPDGSPLGRELTATVIGPDVARGAFEWLSPSDAVAPEPATTSSSGDGLARWVWAPSDAVGDPEAWRSTVTLTENLPTDFVPDGPEFTCQLERPGQSASVVTMLVEVVTEEGSAGPVALYSFPGFAFLAGDSVRCGVGDRAVPTTTTSTTTTTTTTTSTTTTTTTTTSTTVPETTTTTEATTTVPATTTAPATTLAPATTTAPPPDTTTAPETTTTTAPAGANAMQIIDDRADLSTLRALIDSVGGLRDFLENTPDPYTLFAPNNDAFAALAGGEDPPDLGNTDIATEVLLAHLSNGEALTVEQIAERSEIQVDFGPPHPVDASVDPLTVGGAAVIESPPGDPSSPLHILDTVLVPPLTS